MNDEVTQDENTEPHGPAGGGLGTTYSPDDMPPLSDAPVVPAQPVGGDGGGTPRDTIVIGGDQNIDYNIIQVEDKNEKTSTWTGRFQSYIRASYGGPSLLAYMLQHTSKSVRDDLPLYDVSPVYAKAKPVAHIAEYPAMLTLWTEHDKKLNDGSNKDVAWRIKESLSNTFIRDDCFVLPDLDEVKNNEVKTPRIVLINDFNTHLRWMFSPEVFSRELKKPNEPDLSGLPEGERAKAGEDYTKAYNDYEKYLIAQEKAQKIVTWITKEPSELRFVVVKVKDRDITHSTGPDGKAHPRSKAEAGETGDEASGQNVMLQALLQKNTALTLPDAPTLTPSEQERLAAAQELAAERLIVLTSIDDLRGCGAVISREMSWERTTQDIINYMSENISACGDALYGCRHIVVSLGTAGAVYIRRGESVTDVEATLFFTKDIIESSFQQLFPGGMRGYDTCLVCSVAHHLMVLCTSQKQGSEGAAGTVEETGEQTFGDNFRRKTDAVAKTEAALQKGIANGILSARLFHRCGLVKKEAGVTDENEETNPLLTQFVGQENLGSPHPLYLPTQYIKKVMVRSEFRKRDDGTVYIIDALHDRENERFDGYVCAIEVPQAAIHKIVAPREEDDNKVYFERSWWSFFDQEVVRQAAKKAMPRDKVALKMAEDVLRKGLKALTYNEEDKNEARPFACPDGKLYKVPVATFGEMETVDRHEMESFRSLRALIQGYEQSGRDKPLNIGVFGPPGSGKSFAVKQIAKSLGFPLKDRTFNLSQFENAELLFEALHEVRDINLEGKMPLVFWDEFDTSFAGTDFGWLHYFLAPMQDGRFQMAQVSHPIGKAIFVFAGSIFHRFSELPLATSVPSTDTSKEEQRKHWMQAKGVDFVSRLEGSIDIEGPNKPQSSTIDEPDHYNYLVRRALLVRGILWRNFRALFGRDDILRIDQSVVEAFLQTPEFYHGARSIEKIIMMSSLNGASSFKVSYLPADFQVGLHVNTFEFERHYRMKR